MACRYHNTVRAQKYFFHIPSLNIGSRAGCYIVIFFYVARLLWHYVSLLLSGSAKRWTGVGHPPCCVMMGC